MLFVLLVWLQFSAFVHVGVLLQWLQYNGICTADVIAVQITMLFVLLEWVQYNSVCTVGMSAICCLFLTTVQYCLNYSTMLLVLLVWLQMLLLLFHKAETEIIAATVARRIAVLCISAAVHLAISSSVLWQSCSRPAGRPCQTPSCVPVHTWPDLVAAVDLGQFLCDAKVQRETPFGRCVLIDDINDRVITLRENLRNFTAVTEWWGGKSHREKPFVVTFRLGQH